LFCRKHRTGIRSLEGHLKDAHGLRTKKERQPILDCYASLVLLHPKVVRQPPHNCTPFEALGDPIDGWQCSDSDCNHISVNYKSMRGHCNTVHNWQVSKDERTHWRKVQVQTFFGVGFQRYFIVATPEANSEAHSDVEEDVAIRNQLLREFKDLNDQDQKRLEIVDDKTEKSDNTGWWSFVQWRPHFGSRNIRRIAHVSRLPDRKDKQLQRASEIVSIMIKRAVDGLSSLHDDTPYWLRTANSTEKVENRPMVRLQNEDSLDRYIAYLRRFACYLLRVYVAQKERATEESLGREETNSTRNKQSCLTRCSSH